MAAGFFCLGVLSVLYDTVLSEYIGHTLEFSRKRRMFRYAIVMERVPYTGERFDYVGLFRGVS